MARGARLAVTGADDAFHANLRRSLGLAPGSDAQPEGLAYIGREFRVYTFMRIGDAVRFFSALHGRWDADALAADFETSGLNAGHEVRRMKRTYQRALVLALAMAAVPDLLVVELGEEFDEEPTRALLRACVERAPRAIVTFAASAAVDAGWFDGVVSASEFSLEEVA